jgi:hypothetical protein
VTKETVEKVLNGKVVDTEGEITWYVDGKLHREDGPAVERVDGGKIWYHHGVVHRTDGPAVIQAGDTKFWMLNGKIVDADGPGVELKDGR